MSLEKFNLAWDKFKVATCTTFNNLFEDQDFTDVTLVCDDDKQIKAHKVILSSSSSFLRKILLKNPHQHPILYLKGIGYSDLQAVVRFLYFGEAEVAQDNLESFLAAAKELEIEGLMNSDSQESKTENADVETIRSEPGIKPEFEEYKLESDQFDTYPVLSMSSEMYENDYNGISERVKVKNYSCADCEKTFTQPGTLNRHKKTVHGGARYISEFCQREFSQSGSLATHIKTVHSVNSMQ